MALSHTALDRLDRGLVALPSYDAYAIKPGVLHFGAGAFHRAHQADYFDRLLSHDPTWGVIGASFHSTRTRDALNVQDGLYTLAVLDEEIRFRVLGATKRIVMSGDENFRDALISPETRLISLTITEKGYCLDSSGALDFSHPDIAHDLENPQAPVSAIGWIVEGLRIRFGESTIAPDILSCDNLPGNGDKLRCAVVAFAAALDSSLSDRIADNICFPNSMVDSITPATDEALRDMVRREAGIDDRWPVQREAFSTWVIEDRVSQGFPDLQSVGAIMTGEVAAHEKAKLRMLNGAHSTLAYMGLARGYATVCEATSDLPLGGFLDDMMRLEIAPGIKPPTGLDLEAYRHALLKRFRNPAIAHQLSQIAWDGSQKIPIRLLETIADNIRADRPYDRLCEGVAAWMRFIRRQARSRGEIVDPLEDALRAVGIACRDDPQFDCDLFLQRTNVFAAIVEFKDVFAQVLRQAYCRVLLQEERSPLAMET